MDQTPRTALGSYFCMTCIYTRVIDLRRAKEIGGSCMYLSPLYTYRLNHISATTPMQLGGQTSSAQRQGEIEGRVYRADVTLEISHESYCSMIKVRSDIRMRRVWYSTRVHVHESPRHESPLPHRPKAAPPPALRFRLMALALRHNRLRRNQPAARRRHHLHLRVP